MFATDSARDVERTKDITVSGALAESKYYIGFAVDFNKRLICFGEYKC